MLNYNEIVQKKYIVIDGDPYEVTYSHVSRKQANKPNNQTKLKNLISGRTIERSFHMSEKAEESDIESRDIKYLYSGKGESWFCDPKNPADRFAVKSDILEGKEVYLKPNTIVSAVVFEEKVIGVRLPIKVELIVKEAPPAVRGNTAQGASKQVVVETGATVVTPLFVNEGDIIRINTDTGEYVERVRS